MKSNVGVLKREPSSVIWSRVAAIRDFKHKITQVETDHLDYKDLGISDFKQHLNKIEGFLLDYIHLKEKYERSLKPAKQSEVKKRQGGRHRPRSFVDTPAEEIAEDLKAPDHLKGDLRQARK